MVDRMTKYPLVWGSLRLAPINTHLTTRRNCSVIFLPQLRQGSINISSLNLIYKAEKLSVCLSVFWYWVNNNSVMAAWIIVKLARCDSCVFWDHKIYFFKFVRVLCWPHKSSKDAGTAVGPCRKPCTFTQALSNMPQSLFNEESFIDIGSPNVLWSGNGAYFFMSVTSSAMFTFDPSTHV